MESRVTLQEYIEDSFQFDGVDEDGKKKKREKEFRIRIETSGGISKRITVKQLHKDFLVTVDGENIRYSHIGSFVDVSGEQIK
jgi:hypothetical protein